MSYFEHEMKRAARANEIRRKTADVELGKLSLGNLFETGDLTGALYKAAKWAEKHDCTYREIVVAIMESLPEEWLERVEDTLQGEMFMESAETVTKGGIFFAACRGELLKMKFLHEDPTLRKNGGGLRKGLCWTRIWTVNLKHQLELRTMEVKLPASRAPSMAASMATREA